jgi:hypothetical protein
MWAQEIGAKVRVRDSNEVLATGTLVSLDSNVVVRTAVLDNRGNWSERDFTIPVTTDIRMDTVVGRRSSGGKGALIGFGVGMGFTVLATILAANDPSNTPGSMFYVAPGAVFLGGTVVIGGGGALIGYGIGSASKSDVWAEAPLELSPRRDPHEMTEGMMRLGLRINF